MTTPCRTINANAIAAPSSSGLIFNGFRDFVPIEKRVVISNSRGLKLPLRTTKTVTSSAWRWSYRSPGRLLSSRSASTSTSVAVTSNSANRFEVLEEGIEKVIYSCRFMTFLGTLGSLLGSVLCFIKGCMYVVDSFLQYSVNRGKVIFLLVEAIDIYLLGTVMLVESLWHVHFKGATSMVRGEIGEPAENEAGTCNSDATIDWFV
ncbi:unnamed protein product [Arabidopsis arenosa]|uniref:Uncharacterized protein n=1 Tax=Arabidopsis arenosa TaxID=38785 RepID=A0A8S2B126_ARAAE|nr:unnamed protein product [Arabidopsis arenosa]